MKYQSKMTITSTKHLCFLTNTTHSWVITYIIILVLLISSSSELESSKSRKSGHHLQSTLQAKNSSIMNLEDMNSGLTSLLDNKNLSKYYQGSVFFNLPTDKAQRVNVYITNNFIFSNSSVTQYINDRSFNSSNCNNTNKAKYSQINEKQNKIPPLSLSEGVNKTSKENKTHKNDKNDKKEEIFHKSDLDKLYKEIYAKVKENFDKETYNIKQNYEDKFNKLNQVSEQTQNTVKEYKQQLENVKIKSESDKKSLKEEYEEKIKNLNKESEQEMKVVKEKEKQLKEAKEYHETDSNMIDHLKEEQEKTMTELKDLKIKLKEKEQKEINLNKQLTKNSQNSPAKSHQEPIKKETKPISPKTSEQNMPPHTNNNQDEEYYPVEIVHNSYIPTPKPAEKNKPVNHNPPLNNAKNIVPIAAPHYEPLLCLDTNSVEFHHFQMNFEKCKQLNDMYMSLVPSLKNSTKKVSF